MNYCNQIIDNEIVVYANDSLYSKDSIFKCLYWYSSDFHVNISLADSNTFKISLKPLTNENLSPIQLDNILHKLEKDLIDFNLRDIVTKETKNIRDLLTAKAFSNGEFDEEPPGQISDPVGFNINDTNND
jgi:His-Xaa-Ser system protein HxsD